MGLFTAFLVTSKHVKRANLGTPTRTSEETVARNISVSEENKLAPSRNIGPNSIQIKYGFHARSGLLQDSEIVNLDERNPETGAGITGEGFADAEEDDSKDCPGVILINHGSHDVGALSEEQLSFRFHPQLPLWILEGMLLIGALLTAVYNLIRPNQSTTPCQEEGP